MSTRAFDWILAIGFGLFLGYCAAKGIYPV
ncbi:hypothetical protein CBA19CS22_37970 [Caballeronia novacaledonica]|uniref:Uncharacterized protein n=1 Tax=Caballeronia novacaledonica TaxID=1544861 RepID=A0ACB5R533_9BURK|nr:hypothetical protein CBA19CS22_37970 [Caballeronia novacaledonica]